MVRVDRPHMPGYGLAPADGGGGLLPRTVIAGIENEPAFTDLVTRWSFADGEAPPAG